MNRQQILWLVGLAIANFLFSLWMGQQAYQWMPPQASAEAVLVDRLFSLMTAIGSFIFVGVTGTLLYSVIFQRAAKYDASDGPPIEGNIKLEVIWTAIPILLVIWIATASYQTYRGMGILGAITNEGVSTAVTAGMQPIEVHAKQWSWEFYYPDAGISSTELHLPINQRSHFKLTSEDVLHGFFVPAFRVKQDVVPGKEIDFSFTPIRLGRYRVRDSEYSGTYFAANQTNVVVESADEYQQWLAAAAERAPASAANAAYDEYQKVSRRPGFRYKTIQPAPAPIVNYSIRDR
ncbi:MAG: cytochrome c oxidase subunit II [Cyanobacteria bacterium P01_D01_bin.156]